MDFNIIKRAKFDHPDLASITIIFEDEPDFEIPKEFYVMPKNTKDDFITYHCVAKSTTPSEFCVFSTKRTYYIIETETEDTPKLREELRVNISMKVEAVLDGISTPQSITIKNVSAGGIMFVSEQRLEPGMLVSFSFAFGNNVVPVKAHIVRVRPTHLPDIFCYSCRFVDLPRQSEAAIRNFVFTEDLRQKRSKL